jgi:hypothetical protein
MGNERIWEMETKRCQRCHKLLRADASVCNRCGGLDFLQVTHARTGRTGATKEPPSIPSNPPASPHRAGHYSGLHPEDQPYQSSFLPVQRPPAPTHHIFEGEANQFSPSRAVDSSLAPAPVSAPKRRIASFSPSPEPEQQRSIQTNGQIFHASQVQQYEVEPEHDEQPEQSEAYQTFSPAQPPNTPNPLPLEIATPVRKRRVRGRAVPILLITSCFLFLVATSILAFLLLDTRPTTALKPKLFAEPNSLRATDILELSGSGFRANALVNFTRDTANIPILHGDAPLRVSAWSTGNFSVQIPIPGSWSLGEHIIYASDQDNNRASTTISIQSTPPTPPLLQLMTTSIDVGADNASVVSRKDFTLTNEGGDQVNWQANSDAPWLTISQTKGTFAGSEVVTIVVDRSNLSAQSYTGHITFTEQDGKNKPLVLTVTMAVNPASANLVLSNAALTVNGTPAQNPVNQSITIQNTGGQPLDWTAVVSTATGGNWLSLSPGNGHLLPGSQTTMTVIASSLGLAVGNYQGTLTFSYAGATATPVMVTMIVSPPPVAKLAVTTNNLAFNAIQGQNPQPKSFTISNPGNAPLNWGIIEDASSLAIAPVSPSRGTLAPSGSTMITVTPMISQINAGVVNAIITIVDTDTGSTVKSQQVKVTFTIVNQAVIDVNPNQIAFDHNSTITISTQPLLITNTGSAPLNWTIQISNSSPIQWLSVDNSGGTLVPSGLDFVNVMCDSTHLSPGIYTATLQVKDTAGTPVTPQTIKVTVTVS